MDVWGGYVWTVDVRVHVSELVKERYVFVPIIIDIF